MLPTLERYLPKLFPTASDKGRPGLTVVAIASILLNLRFADLSASSQTVVICCLCISLAIVGIIPPCLKKEYHYNLLEEFLIDFRFVGERFEDTDERSYKFLKITYSKNLHTLCNEYYKYLLHKYIINMNIYYEFDYFINLSNM